MINLAPLNIGTIHLIGIGGIGMSGIAEILHSLGYKVQGSDAVDSQNVQRLLKKDIKVFIGHHPDNIKDVTTIVCSTAVKTSNPEVTTAHEKNIPVITRAEMLSEIMRFYATIAISGTHGKTTTTSLIAHILHSLDPTVINGGIINAYGSNTRIGSSHWMIVEADESDATFVRVPSTITVVTNVDPEHLDFYGSFENLKNHFTQFIEGTAFYGFSVICYDHPTLRDLHHRVKNRRIITYGFHPQAGIRGLNVREEGGLIHFDVEDHVRGCLYKDVALAMVGHHNVQNSLAAIAIAMEMGVTEKVWRRALETFEGVRRRFTKVGTYKGMQIIDDYAHHPAEIKAVLEAARGMKPSSIIAILQPHRYSRLNDLFMDFVASIEKADSVFVMPVYEAGETPIEGATHTRLAEEMRLIFGEKDIRACDSFESLFGELRALASEGQYQIFLGAGDVSKYAYSYESFLNGSKP